MQVITSKDAEIENLRKLLAEEMVNLKTSKVCVRVKGRWLVKGEVLCMVTDPNNRAGTYTYIFVNMSYQADAETKDLKERLVAAEKQLAEEQANFKKTKVCVRGYRGMI